MSSNEHESGCENKLDSKITEQEPTRLTWSATSLISLQVKDQEFPFNRDLARILVAVEDSNDNIPYFTSTVYDAVAYESSPIGTSVIQVTALDKDNGINGQLTYSIEAGVMLSLKFSILCSTNWVHFPMTSATFLLILRKHWWCVWHRQHHWPHLHSQVPGPQLCGLLHPHCACHGQRISSVNGHGLRSHLPHTLGILQPQIFSEGVPGWGK